MVRTAKGEVEVERLAARRRWTEADARIVVAAADASAESLSAFCRRYGLDGQRIHWWRSRLGAGGSRMRSPRFAPVRVIPSPSPAEIGIGEPCELVSPRGWRIRVSSAVDDEHLERLVRILAAAGC